MKIEISQAPPSDIFKDRVKYLWVAALILSLALIGILLIIYGIFSDAPASPILEKVALGLLFGPAVLFTYFGPKLRAYKRLLPREKEELLVLSLKHPEISTYLKQVSGQDRQPILAEYEACKEWAENEEHKGQSE
ncbi:MAG: hypothetical protein LC633_02700 [Desulfobulbaceae bacterium]|nr:hypothetical protein [Desulfobulbaceae bacterium]